MTRDSFLQLLFEPGELTCFADSPMVTELSSEPLANDLFFSINPMHTKRADDNVTVFRNFLLELDNVPIYEQIQLVTSKVPVSSIVFSGNKSYHFIISLSSPCETISEYRAYSRALLEAVPEADKSTKNPSRLSRLPGAIRPDTKLLQELVYLGSKIDKQKLPSPVPYREPVETSTSHSKVFVTRQLLSVLQVGVDEYIQGHFSGRNQFFYWLGRRCSELGLSREEKKKKVDYFYQKMQNKKNFSIREAYMAARVPY